MTLWNFPAVKPTTASLGKEKAPDGIRPRHTWQIRADTGDLLRLLGLVHGDPAALVLGSLFSLGFLDC